MSRAPPLALVLVSLCALLVLLPAPAAAGNASVVAVHPNPVTADDVGEFVVVRARNATLSDGEDTVHVNGTIVLSPDPAAARNLTDRRPVREADIALANGGENFTISRGGRTLATLAYEDAPAGETLRNGTWRAPGATAFDALRARNVPVRTFVLPDAPGPPVSVLDDAESRLFVGAYTFTSERATRALLAAEHRGVDTRVLVEGGPVGAVLAVSLAAASVALALRRATTFERGEKQ